MKEEKEAKTNSDCTENSVTMTFISVKNVTLFLRAEKRPTFHLSKRASNHVVFADKSSVISH